MSGKGVPITQQERDRVLKIREQTGMSAAKIAHEERLSTSTVQKIIKTGR